MARQSLNCSFERSSSLLLRLSLFPTTKESAATPAPAQRRCSVFPAQTSLAAPLDDLHLGVNRSARELSFTAKTEILPTRYLLVLRAKNEQTPTPDYALFLLDIEGRIAAWYAGAERIYGYKSSEILGQQFSALSLPDDAPRAPFRDQLNRAVTEGHSSAEGWQIKKDGSRFWANAAAVALKDGNGTLQGFAAVVRDFGERHEQDEKLHRTRGRLHPPPAESAIAGIVSGEFDRILEANDTFLELTGYTREDLQAGRLTWAGFSSAEYLGLDELAHEEALRFGACTPFEKELLRKDGTRVAVAIATAVLKVSPFRWITFRGRSPATRAEGECHGRCRAQKQF